MAIEKRNIQSFGFLHDMAYLADLPNLLNDYDNQFGEAEELDFSLEEEIGSTSLRKEPILFSEDGKKVTINILERKYYNAKGKVTSIPEPEEVFRHINFVMKRAVKEYAKKFLSEEGDPEPDQK
jgi:hypothetical protein